MRSTSVSPDLSVSSVRVSETVRTAMFTGLKGLVSSMRFMGSLYPRTRHPSMFAITEPIDTAEGFFLAPPGSHQDFPLILHHGDLVISPLEISRTIPSLLPDHRPKGS
jgi:hypothetical protein